jgi:Ni/Fe-hydrogenase 1 B-type cytochrome subunit
MQKTRMQRVWHWADAVAIFGLIATVILRETYLNKHHNAPIIQKALADQDISISLAGAIKVAKAIRAPMWDWHYVFGYTVLALLIMRGAMFIWHRDQAVWRESLFGSSELRACVFDGECRRRVEPRRYHTAWVHCLYILLYAGLVIATITGVILYLNAYAGLAFAHPTKQLFEDIHIVVGWFVVGFVPVHIAGVVIAEIKTKNHEVSNMIDGGP